MEKKGFCSWLLNLLFPKHIKCVFCGKELNENAYNDTCEDCLKDLPYITYACARCGGPITENNDGVCLDCKMNNYNFAKAKSALIYKDSVVRAVHKFKYNGQKFLCVPFANLMFDELLTWDVNVDVVTNVPMFKKKEKARRYNQSTLLAKEIAEKLNVPFVEFTFKVVDNSTQTKLSYKERRENVKDVYVFNKELKPEVKGKSVLVVDDIFTTGATSDEIAKVLMKAGAKEVNVLTLAHAVVEENNKK